jgi:uncharacterized SAM-binding protein YcdF (DUF218 family)
MPKLMHKATPVRRTIKRLGLNALGLVGLYGTGFAVYVALLPTPFTTLPPEAEGLAVFSGGAGRIENTLRAIEQGFQGPVLISGLHPSTTFADILAQTPTGEALNIDQRRQIMLDTAASTAENMQSLKLWAATTNLKHVAVITSTYHAARVRLLGWWKAPNLTLYILAVQPENPKFNVLLREYHKLLGTPFLR